MMTSRKACNLFLLLVSFVVSVGVAFAEAPAPELPMPQARHGRTHMPARPVRHDTPWKAVPGSKLEIRAVEYDGATNGWLKVEVRNKTQHALAFSATGLYFVPDGDPDTAPQRLGAVGPLQHGDAKKELASLEIAAGATTEVALEVFCIDSHRPSPSTANTFLVGAKRLPKNLSQTIETRAVSAKAAYRGNVNAAPAAKSAVQSEVWRSRDARWVELEGEGTQEAGKKRK